MPIVSAPQLPTVAVTLRDGSMADLRPVAPEDRALLEAGLQLMSPEARFARFGSGIDHLSEAELDYLTQLDQVGHVAWGAAVDDVPAGVSRYVVVNDRSCAEVAVAVGDPFQRRGLGRALFEALVASARHNGIEQLCFWVHPSNEHVLRMLQGIETELDDSEGMVTGSFELADIAPRRRDAEFVALLKLARA